MSGNFESERKKVLAPDDGGVVITVETNITEQEIVEERQSIVQRLHMGYMNLNEGMKEFQQQWDQDGRLSLLTAAYDGGKAGGGAWWDDFDDMFEKKTWVELGDKVKNFSGEVYDRTAVYSKKFFTELSEDINKLTENPDDTLYNWAWWQKTVSETAQQEYEAQMKRLEELRKTAHNTSRVAGEALFSAQKIYIHRNAILNLPTLIASGDVKGVQAFIDKELKDIDADLAKAIKNDPNYSLVLEVIQDHDSALTYLSYASLMIETVPPNFYAYIAARGGIYLLIEVVLLIVTAILSAGTAAAARIATLVARLATTGAKVAGSGGKLRHAQAAINAMTRMIQDISDAADSLHMLGYKLKQARSKGLVLRGSTQTTLTGKKDNIKRDKKCRLCGSTAHVTPRYRLGTVVYK